MEPFFVGEIKNSWILVQELIYTDTVQTVHLFH